MNSLHPCADALTEHPTPALAHSWDTGSIVADCGRWVRGFDQLQSRYVRSTLLFCESTKLFLMQIWFLPSHAFI